MSREKVIIIEDEPKVALFIKKGLEEQDFDADIAYDGKIGKEMILKGKYDIAVLDLNLPVLNGFELCKTIREKNMTLPVLMLTALDTTEDKLAGFENGADDYLVKPFEFRELVARMKALIKRSKNNISYGSVIQISDLVLNSDTKIVSRNGQAVELTAKEFALLELLMRNKEKVISRAEIANHIWDINFDTGTNVIDVYINFLRKKIDKNHPVKLIQTQIGMGYTIREPA